MHFFIVTFIVTSLFVRKIQIKNVYIYKKFNYYYFLSSMEDVEKFQQRLKKFREDRGYSQAKFARMIGISRRMMCYYEKESNAMPSSGIILKMAQSLDCSVDALLDLKEEKVDGRTTEARLVKKFKDAAKLPETDRNILIQMLDALLLKNKMV